MPLTRKLKKAAFACNLFVHLLQAYLSFILRNQKPRRLTAPEKTGKPQNIVVVGANFAGYHAARILALDLPPESPYRVVVVEPNSHFNFTWVLPRFCVVEGGHEHKAFIPYGPNFKGAPVEWVQDRVVRVTRTSVELEKGNDIPYEFLIIATGSGVGDVLPSRVGASSKLEGTELLRGMQQSIKLSQKLLVVGAGAAGVELATDVKSVYPEKSVTLVHSRDAVMHRFGPELQAEALRSLQALGVQVILGDRLVDEDAERGNATLKSGMTVECDYIVRCIGQRPNSNVVADIAKHTITPDGHIRTKPTLQIADDSLPNIYVCGDVAAHGEQNPNARSAMRMAMIAADNVILAASGNAPRHQYEPLWADRFIKLTLGMDRSVNHFGDGKTELLVFQKETDPGLMTASTWLALGVTPFEDKGFDDAVGRGKSDRAEVSEV